MPDWKIPESVLVVIYTPQQQVLLLRRADTQEDCWQSVTGSKDRSDEPWHRTAVREVAEETGIQALAPTCSLTDWGLENRYAIAPPWRHRYAPEVTHNTERVWGLCVPAETSVRLNPREHTACQWLPWRQAARCCFSPSNAQAILWLPRFAGL